MSRLGLARIFWFGAAAILIVAAVLGIAGLLRGDFTETDGKILITLLTLLVSSGTAVAGLTLVERNQNLSIGWGAAGVAGVSFVLVTAATWEEFDTEPLWKSATTSALALVATLLGTTQLVIYRGGLRPVVVGTWLAVSLGAATTALGVWDDPAGDGLWKTAGTLWILGVLGWLLVPVLQRFTAAGPTAEFRVLAALDDIELVATRSGGIDPHLAPGERLALRRRV